MQVKSKRKRILINAKNIIGRISDLQLFTVDRLQWKKFSARLYCLLLCKKICEFNECIYIVKKISNKSFHWDNIEFNFDPISHDHALKQEFYRWNQSAITSV